MTSHPAFRALAALLLTALALAGCRREPPAEDLSTVPGDPVAVLLDRAGTPMAVPLQVSAREESGVRWIAVETALAPLAPGDYAVEVKAGASTRTTAFRVVP